MLSAASPFIYLRKGIFLQVQEWQALLIKVTCPEDIILDDERHNPGLQFCHEGVLPDYGIYVLSLALEVKFLKVYTFSVMKVQSNSEKQSVLVFNVYFVGHLVILRVASARKIGNDKLCLMLLYRKGLHLSNQPDQAL